MKEISLNEKKSIMLSMMTELHDFCEENKITYFLTGGSLLGAIRHNGYIPWDDDIDICLPRKDYDRLISTFASFSGNVSIRSIANTKGYMWPMAKAVDNRTLLIESKREVKGMGVYIDIFPLDNLPDDYELAKKYTKKVCRVKKAITLKYLRLRKGRSPFKNLAVILLKALCLVPTKWFIKKIDRLSRKYENVDTKYVCNLSGAWGIREISEKANFAYGLKHAFENKEFNIPVGYDRYLTDVYGDYMTPPPPEKQISHHDSIVYWR